jgi:hypothetical protein
MKNIFELIDNIKQHKSMYIPPKRDIRELETILHGYITCQIMHGIIEINVPFFKHFTNWLHYKYDWDLCYGWAHVMLEKFGENSFSEFFSLVEQFRRLIPKELGKIQLKESNDPTGKRVVIGMNTLMKKPKTIFIFQYIHENLFYLIYEYPEKREMDSTLYTSLKCTQKFVEDEFQVKKEDWILI